MTAMTQIKAQSNIRQALRYYDYYDYYDGSILSPSSSVSMISWTGSILSDSVWKLMSEEEGRNMSRFQSNPCDAFTHVNKRGEPSLIPRSNTECSTLRTLELRRDGRLWWGWNTAPGVGICDGEIADDADENEGEAGPIAAEEEEEEEEDGDEFENALSRPALRGMEIAPDADMLILWL